MTASPFSPDEIRVAAELHAELGPDYQDAVMESFLAKVDRQIDARVDARVAASRRATGRRSGLIAADTHRGYSTGLISGLVLGIVATGIPLTIFAQLIEDNGGGGDWPDRLWFIWVAIVVAYVAAAVTRNRHRRQLARAAQNSASQGQQ
jgi:hypothetical protein